MAKDDELDDDERELIRQHRAQRDEGTDEVEVGLGDGKYFRGSYKRALSLGYVKEPAPKDDKPAKDDGPKQRFGRVV